MMQTLQDAAIAACAEVGIAWRDVPADGQFHTTDVEGSRNGKGDGRIKLFADGQGGVVWNWKGEQKSFFVDAGRRPTDGDRQARAKQREITDTETKQRREQARQQAQEIWQRCKPIDSHPYLERKCVKAYGLRLYSGPLAINGMRADGALVIPVRDSAGVLQTLEFIGADGEKRFLPKGAKAGHYFAIGKPVERILIAEGYATGASIREATGDAVAVAFDAGNLGAVAKALRDKYPNAKIIIAADNDQWTAGNPGITKAREAAQAVGGFVAVPEFTNEADKPTDFNDLHRLEGLEAVAKAFQVPEAPQVTEIESGVRVTLLRAGDIQPEPIRWLWDGWLAKGKLHILAGQPGTGKTTIAVALAATATIAGRWPDGTRCAACNVLVWSGEDDPKDTLLPRFIAQGADRQRVYFIGDVRADGERRSFDPSKDMQALIAEAQRIGNIGLLIVDPIVNAVAGDSHKAAEVRRSLQPLVDLSAKLDAAVLGISHLAKGTAGREPLERVNGSGAFGALPRVVMLAAKSQEADAGERMLMRAKSNIGPDGGGYGYVLEQSTLKDFPEIIASRVLWGNPLEGTARELLATAEIDAGDDRSQIDQACDWLKDRLEYGRVEAREIFREGEREGFNKRILQRARERIGAISERAGFGKDLRGVWRIDDNPAIGDNTCLPQKTVTNGETVTNGVAEVDGVNPPFVTTNSICDKQLGLAPVVTNAVINGDEGPDEVVI